MGKPVIARLPAASPVRTQYKADTVQTEIHAQEKEVANASLEVVA